MSTPVRVGISPCPNDTFAFHGILEHRVDLRGLDLRLELLDVEELNRRLARGELDVAKASFHAALHMSHEVLVLPTGSALGFGVGPVLLAAPGRGHPRDPLPGASRSPRRPRVLCPGARTTASLLYHLFHAGEGEVDQVVFSDIMPALVEGHADFGVCIHEGRFTYARHGLRRVEDLGEVWEKRAGAPLPLGGILGRRSAGRELLRDVQAVIRDSLGHALAHRRETLSTMRRHARELADEVIWAHVDLYVGAWTLDLGREGRRALGQLSRLARESGLVPAAQPPLEILDP